MEYKVAYIVNNDTSYLVTLLWLLGVGAIAFIIYKSEMGVKKICASILVCIMLIVGSFSFISQLSEKYHNISLLNSGKCSVTEGYVENFDPAPASGHKNESFILNGKKFSYSDYDVSTGAFNQTYSHGGPIYQGRWVRISYKDNLILKIEVRD